MVDCNCGDYGKPISGIYHAHHCQVTKHETSLHEGEDFFYVTIPEHDYLFGGSDKNRLSTPWPTLELAEGAMHRLLHAYPERAVLLWHGDVVIDMRTTECPILYEYRKNHHTLRDIHTGERV